MPTGAANGIVVIDVDVKNNKNGTKAIDELIAREERINVKLAARTPSGGFHLHFRHRDGVRNSADQIGVGVDVRGDGGYVILPPSQIDQGAYEWCNGFAPNINAPLAESAGEMPEALFQAIINAKNKKKSEPTHLELRAEPTPCVPSQAAQVTAGQAVARRSAAWSYFEAAVRDECKKVATCMAGQNEQLNRSAFVISQLVHSYDVVQEGQCTPREQIAEWARRRLNEAAAGMATLNPEDPWNWSAIEPTINSGWQAGAQVPHAGSPNYHAPALQPPANLPALLPARQDELELRPPTAEEAAEIDEACVSNLEGKWPAPTYFAISKILPIGAVALLSGPGGVGKSSLRYKRGSQLPQAESSMVSEPIRGLLLGSLQKTDSQRRISA